MEIKSRKLDFEEREIADDLLRKVTENEPLLGILVYEYVWLKKKKKEAD